MVFRLLENEFVSQKLKVKIFSHACRENFAPGSYHHLREITQSPRQCFFQKPILPLEMTGKKL